jgi:hypothetical protein
MELFDLPPQRLDQDTHDAVFTGLPTSLAAALHTAEIGDVVLQLLDRGWRAGQLAARVGAMPSGPDAEGDVLVLLRGFLEQVPPDARWREEKAQRAAAGSQAQFEAPASEESRQRWITQIRHELGSPRTPRPLPLLRVRPDCALCGAESEFFVTRAVRLCGACVELLASGTATLSEAG